MWKFALMFLAQPAFADSVVTTRAIAAGAVISAEDVTLVAMEIPQSVTRLEDALGKTMRTDIAPGRALLTGQLDYAMRIERNTVVPLVLQKGGLKIRTDGRTLSAGSVGDTIEIMNISSRARIAGIIQGDGSVLVVTAP